MSARYALAVVLLAALASADHGDPMLPYVEASGHFRLGLVAVGVGAVDDGDPVPSAGVGSVNYRRIPFEAQLCHPRLQILLGYEPRNASVGGEEASVATRFTFQVELFDAPSGERLPGAVFPFSSPGEAHYLLDAASVGTPLRADLYMLRGAEADWTLAVRGFPHASLPCDLAPVVNEVEADPPGADAGAQWVELHNPNVVPVDASGWKVKALVGGGEVVLGAGIALAPGGHLVVTMPASEPLSGTGEVVVLEDATGAEKDRTLALDDAADDGRTNQRVPDGPWGTWTFATATPGTANG